MARLAVVLKLFGEPVVEHLVGDRPPSEDSWTSLKSRFELAIPASKGPGVDDRQPCQPLVVTCSCRIVIFIAYSTFALQITIHHNATTCT